MIAPIDKIKKLLNDDIITLFGEDIINKSFVDAYRVVNNLITDESVLEALFTQDLDDDKFSTTYDGTTDSQCDWNDEGYSDSKRILAVQRKNFYGVSKDDKYYDCYKISFLKGETSASNVNSLFYENDRWDPKYYINNDSKIVILPSDTYDGSGNTRIPKGRIFWHTFPTFHSFQTPDRDNTFNLSGKNFSDITKPEEGIIFYGIPSGARELVYLEMVLNLLQVYMADFVYNEEDTELVSLIKEQAAALLGKKNEELNYVIAKYGKPRKIAE